MLVERWFRFVNSKPVPILLVTLIVFLASSAFLPRLYKDTSPDAYIEPTNPALIYRDKVKDIFGLDDPFVVAIEAPQGQTIYEPESLRLVADITDIMTVTENINPGRVVSLTTESIIEGTEEEFRISAAFDVPPTDPVEIQEIREKIENFPILMGGLVARDGTMTLIIGEMMDPDLSNDTFVTLSLALDDFSKDYAGTIHLAGEAATAGYLDDYISQDARRQFPFVALFIMLVLAVSFRSVSGVVIPFAVAIAAAACTMGVRAMMDVPFYAISNALIVVIVSIAIADSIHILNEYREELASDQHKTPRDALTLSMTSMFRPITLTTFTTIGGFAGIWFGSDMPPLKAFGASAAFGVLVAWIYSISFLPAVLSFMHRNKKISDVWPRGRTSDHDLAGKFLYGLSRFVVRRAAWVLIIGFAILGVSIWLTTTVRTDYSRIENFSKSEPVRIADTAINESMDGSYRLLVVVDALEPQGLFNPEVLHRIERLEEFALTLPHVQGVNSIVDILKEVNKGLAGGDPAAYLIPDDPDAVAQLFLAYEAFGDPADLEDNVDFDRQLALVKLRTDARSFSLGRPIVLELERYLAEEFNTDYVTGSLSGRVYLNYHWLKSIEENHLISILVAITASFIMAAATFRSLVAAFYCLYHVIFAVFMVYAVMGWFNIPLGITTAMAAAITIGLGIDFSIHSVERVQILATAAGKVTPRTIYRAFQSTGRALLYNMFALCLGFSALLASNNPTVIEFSALLVVAVAANFLASMTVLPTFLLLTKPRFLVKLKDSGDSGRQGRWFALSKPASFIFIAFGSLLYVTYPSISAADELTVETIVQNVNNRDDGKHLIRQMRITTINRKGNSRVRIARGFRLDTETERRSMIAFTDPANIKGTAFLSYDYREPGVDDDQWLYLPTVRRARRIAGADRGEYFLGTDFTYDDLKLEGKISADDYDLILSSDENAAAKGLITIEGIPKTKEILREIGYSRILIDIDPENWMVHEWRIFDIQDNHLKNITFENFTQLDNIWIASIIRVTNHMTGHKTLFEFSDFDFSTLVKPSQLDQRALERGTH